jgi:hypothetical protein
MPHTDGCPEGRSQFLTFKSTDTIVVDRKTLGEIFTLIGDCVDTITNLQHSKVFITAADRCLLDTSNLEVANSVEVGEATLLLRSWLNVVPKSHQDIDGWLQQANLIVYQLLLASLPTNGRVEHE